MSQMKDGSQNWYKREQQNKQATTKNKHKHAKQQRRKKRKQHAKTN